MAEQKRFAGLATRTQLAVANNLGRILSSIHESTQKYRNRELELYDSYYECRQYAGLMPWDNSTAADGGYVPVKQRAPRINIAFAKLLVSRLGSKLIGRRTFPEFKIAEDPDTEEYLRVVIQSSGLRAMLAEPIRRELSSGSVLIRFAIVNGKWKVEHYLAKWCYPVFDANKELEEVTIKYIFDDEKDRDKDGVPKKKWFRMDLGKFRDILYDNPEYKKGDVDPVFTPVAMAEHNLGFVQAEFMRTADMPNKTDGPSLIADILEFIDELNYSFSQSSQAIQYNQDPQLVLTGIEEEELAELIRSAMKAWTLGKEGKAEFLEAGMTGVEAADKLRTSMRLNIQDIARVILLDPEKVLGHAQSGKAMEVLHGPMVELIEELRPQLEKHLTNLVLKMAITNLMFAEQGALVPVGIPDGFKIKSLGVLVAWPEIFPPTMEDIQKKISIAIQAANASIISRKSMTKWVAKDFGIENIEEELAEIASQPVINPFGGF